jgi:lipopolysaccharide transport system ATP-binding protein
MSDTLIKVDGVSKKFCRSLRKSLWYGVKDLGNELRGHRHGGNGELRPGEFWAIKDVSLELKRGECLGLVGRNGAGKTTLLRLLNGLVKPDQGRIEISGRVGALIALGAGFNPILTGRENVYVAASVLGITNQEIDEKFDDIIEFAEIGEFIDAPVQSYSSGMQVRLGFAIATTLNPDILLLDEVLAVGDAAFRAKCFERIGKVLSGASVICISHAEKQVRRICDSVVVLDGGSER